MSRNVPAQKKSAEITVSEPYLCSGMGNKTPLLKQLIVLQANKGDTAETRAQGHSILIIPFLIDVYLS